MYGLVVNVKVPSAGNHTFVLKWDMARVTDGRPLQEYPTTVNTPLSNDNKFMLKTSNNQAITVGYNFSSQ